MFLKAFNSSINNTKEIVFREILRFVDLGHINYTITPMDDLYSSKVFFSDEAVIDEIISEFEDRGSIFEIMRGNPPILKFTHNRMTFYYQLRRLPTRNKEYLEVINYVKDLCFFSNVTPVDIYIHDRFVYIDVENLDNAISKMKELFGIKLVNLGGKHFTINVGGISYTLTLMEATTDEN